MITVITIIIFLISVLLGKILFGFWFNHLSLYVSVWTPMIVLYELKLIRYQELKSEVWFLILFAYLSFLLGILTIYSGFKLRTNKTNNKTYKENVWTENKASLIKILTYLFGIVGFLAALQNWMILLDEFGTIQNVLLNASLVYRMRIERTIEGQIPYLFTFSYVSVFFAAIYSAIKNKISLITLLPFAGVILKEISQSARAGVLNAFFLFISTFLIYRYYFHAKVRKKYLNWKILLGFIFIMLLLIISTTIIRVTRITTEKFKGATTQLNKLESNTIISPSIYLYFSGQIGTLNKVIQIEERSKLPAEKTLTMFYNIISKFNIVKRPKDHDKGYYIPVWMNTGTFLREIFMDYGYLGLIIVPYLIGFLCTLFWYKFFETGSLFYLTILSHCFIIIGFSFVIFVVRLSTWVFPIVILLIITYLLEKKFYKIKI